MIIRKNLNLADKLKTKRQSMQINNVLNSGDIINRLKNRLNKAKNDREMIKTLVDFGENNETQILENGAYKIGDYYLLSGYANPNYDIYKTNILLLNKNNFCATSAPKIEDVIQSKDNKYCVIVQKVKNSANGLSQYAEGSVSEDNRRLFAREMIDLLQQTNLYNPYAFESKKNWFITSEGNIFIDKWGALKECQTEEEKSAIKKKILLMCGIMYE